MHVLIVDDESGIREGLASYLRLKGLIVRTADSVAAARAVLGHDAFDLLVTDWRLGDGRAGAIVERAVCPCLVISGYPEEVTDHPNIAGVLSKPVMPDRVLRAVLELCRGEPSAQPVAEAALPCDTRDRVRVAVALCGDGGATRVEDDGSMVTVRGPLREAAAAPAILEALGGDWRILERDGRPFLELRLFRDGRPAHVDATVRRGAAWPPPPAPVAIDLDGDDALGVTEFVEFLDEVRRAEAGGREVFVLNVPAHLRFVLEALGRGDRLPKRVLSGPRLPEVLTELWR